MGSKCQAYNPFLESYLYLVSYRLFWPYDSRVTTE